MTKHSGALSRSRASHEAAPRLHPSGFDHGYEAWRPALIAFYEKDELPTKALCLKQGEPFDYLDLRAIRALEAALAEVREAA